MRVRTIHAPAPSHPHNGAWGQRATSHATTSARTTVSSIKAAIVALFLLGSTLGVYGQGTVTPTPIQTFFTNAGAPCANCLLYTYVAGSVNTDLATYSNEGLTTELPNPITLNSAGRPTTGAGAVTPIYLSQSSYKFVLTTSGGTTIWSADHIPSIPSQAAALDVEGIAGENLIAGDAVYLTDGSGSQTAGRWYKTDADNTYGSTTAGMVGIVPGNIDSGESGSIRLQGRITGLSALTAGAKYYASATAGGLTATPPTNARFIAEADSTTSIVVGGNPGAVRLPDSNGTHSLVINTTSNLTADRLLTVVPGDAARILTLTGDATVNQDTTTTATGVSFNQFRPPQGRCSLTTATPVTTADVTAATTLYYALYQGNQITLYDGSTRWVQLPFTQLSIAVPATTSQMYDVFVDYTAGTPALELVAWTNDTTRATALATQTGVYVQTADTDSLYVCSFRTTAVSGQTEDSFAKRYVWNYYHRVPRLMRVLEATDSWSYNTATYRQANAAAGNQLDCVIGVAEVALTAAVYAVFTATTAQELGQVSIGEDSTTTPAAGVVGNIQGGAITNTSAGLANISATLHKYPAVGRHIYVWLERGGASGATQTWRGDDGNTQFMQTGIHGWIEG